MKYLFVLFVTGCCLIFSSCGNESNGHDYKAIAGEFCICKQPLVDINKEMKVLLEARKQAEIQALFPKVQAISKETETCTAALSKKYSMPDADEAKAKATMAKVCPEVYAMISAAQAREMEE